MNPFTVIPGFYIFKDCPIGFFEVLIRVKINFLFLQYRMEGFYTGIIIGISLPAKGVTYTLFAQISFECLAGILASQITVKDNSFRFLHIQAGIFHGLYGQLGRHRSYIGIADDFPAAYVHDACQICPSFLQHMDVGNIRTPLLVDGFCTEVTLEDVFFITRNGSLIGVMVIFFTTTDRSSCFCICR